MKGTETIGKKETPDKTRKPPEAASVNLTIKFLLNRKLRNSIRSVAALP